MISRRSRAEIISLIKLTMPWDEVRSDLLPVNEQGIYGHRKSALDKYLCGESLRDIKNATGVGGNYLRKMIARCLVVAPDGRVYGYRALIPNFSVKKYSRKKTFLVSVGAKGSGFSGVLDSLFNRYSGLQASLDSFILKKSSSKGVSDADRFCNRAKDVHYEFIQLLKGRNHPLNEWPYTHKHRGSRTISQYVRNIREKNFERTVRLVGDKSAVAHLGVNSGHPPIIRFRGLNDAWEIDSHKIDAAFSLGLLNSAGLISWDEIKCLHMIVALESSIGASMWYRVVYGDDVTAEDIVALIREAMGKYLPKPAELIPNLVVKKGAGFPSEMFAQLNQSPPTVIRFDNALAHLSVKVSCGVRKQTGCTFEYGPPAHFERRPNIENLFNRFEQEIGQRMRSSTGTGPDGGGDENPGATAVKFGIDSRAIEQLAYVAFANLNVEPCEGIGFLSPKQAIAQLISDDDNHFLPRTFPVDSRDAIGTGLVRETRVVRGGIESGTRPYVNFERARYSSSRFREAINLIGHEIILEIDESDITVVYAFLPTGEPLGPLTAQGAWAETPHSRKTRRHINSLRYLKTISFIEGQNPVRVYNKYLEDQLNAKGSAGKKARKVASEIDRLRTEVIRSEKPSESLEKSALPTAPIVAAEPIPVRQWVLPTQEIDLLDLIRKLK